MAPFPVAVDARMSNMTGMGGMSSSGSSGSSSSSSSTSVQMMPMSSMIMTFYPSTTTALYSTAWSPSTPAQYAGTCIFLIVLATIFRGLFAIRARQKASWHRTDMARRSTVVVAQNDENGRQVLPPREAEKMSVVLNGTQQDVYIVLPTRHSVRPWRLSTDLPRAVLDTVIAGIGYLLMLAVMTFNVGYFLSVLGGIFLGSLLIGRHAEMFLLH